MPLTWANEARANLSTASNNYAKIQKELDKYNKLFQTYATASPETQMRAASVMRQAIDEYNGLKRQQEENALKMYEAQNWVTYYNNSRQATQPAIQNQPTQRPAILDMVADTQRPVAEEVPIVTTQTPWKLNNNTNATLVETNPVGADLDMNLPGSEVFDESENWNKIKPSMPAWVANIINSQVPKYSGTTLNPRPININVTWTNYWPGTANNISNQIDKTLLVWWRSRFQYSPTLRKWIRR